MEEGSPPSETRADSFQNPLPIVADDDDDMHNRLVHAEPHLVFRISTVHFSTAMTKLFRM